MLSTLHFKLTTLNFQLSTTLNYKLSTLHFTKGVPLRRVLQRLLPSWLPTLSGEGRWY